MFSSRNTSSSKSAQHSVSNTDPGCSTNVIPTQPDFRCSGATASLSVGQQQQQNRRVVLDPGKCGWMDGRGRGLQGRCAALTDEGLPVADTTTTRWRTQCAPFSSAGDKKGPM